MTTTAPATTAAATPAVATIATKSGRAPIRGVDYYYEIRGAGEPLLLLHGGLGTLAMFQPILPILTASRQVILVDLHGHGRTSLGNRSINLIEQGDDLAALLDHLGYAKVDVAGYSLGAAIAFRLAVQHPEKVKRLALVSVCFSRDGNYPEMLKLQAQVGAAAAPMMKDTPMYKSYVAVAPNPAEFPKLLDNLGELMRTPYDWTADVEKLKTPVILVYGDSDMFTLDHMIASYKRLGGGQGDAGWQREHMATNRLAILPNLTHYEMFMSPLMANTVLGFLDNRDAPPKWSEQVAKP